MIFFLACAVHELRAIPPGRGVVLPRDDRPHPSAQTEWWHVHADLRDTQTGEPLHAFAGFVVQRTDLDRVLFVPVPAVINPFWAAYVRLADGERAWTADRHNVPDFSSAGARGEGLDVFHGNWSIRREGSSIVLAASAGPSSTELTLTPTRRPVLPGDAGRVEMPEGNAHLWMQEERMEVHGRWEEGNRVRWVEGTGFLKHQWGRLYSPELDGFDWWGGCCRWRGWSTTATTVSPAPARGSPTTTAPARTSIPPRSS
jgi:predicted secreted hydrolase